jgi:hypothetical protein
MLRCRPTSRISISIHTRALRLFLPLLGLLLATLACGFSIGSHMGARPLPVTHRPASQLRLTIEITSQYSHYSDEPNVVVQVRFFEGLAASDEVALAQGAHVTCNGKDMTPTSQAQQLVGAPCPRQPPGGAYQITYTDEHGVAASVVVPVPSGSFAILSPRAGSTVSVPTTGPLKVRFTVPTPPPVGSVAVDGVSAACIATENGGGGYVFASLQDTSTSTAAPRQGIESAATPAPPVTPTRGGAPDATPPVSPAPGNTPTPAPSGNSASATVTQSGGVGTILLKGDFTQFQPGAGRVELEVEAHVTPDRGGFATVTADFAKETISTPLTWAR